MGPAAHPGDATGQTERDEPRRRRLVLPDGDPGRGASIRGTACGEGATVTPNVCGLDAEATEELGALATNACNALTGSQEFRYGQSFRPAYVSITSDQVNTARGPIHFTGDESLSLLFALRSGQPGDVGSVSGGR